MAINFNYSGSGGARVVKPEYLNTLMNEAEQIINRALNQPNLERQKTWFGLNFSDQRKTLSAGAVSAKIALLATYLGANTIEFISKNQKTGAFADQAEIAPKIYLGNWFSFKIYSYGERMVTFFHELSHKAIATKDVVFKGEPAYKGKAVHLATDKSEYGKALDNAENWGYYIVSYARDVGLMNNRKADWSYVTSLLDVESKLGPSGNDNRLTPMPEILLGTEVWTDFTGRRTPVSNPETLPCAVFNAQHVFGFRGNGQVPYVAQVDTLT